MTAPVFGVVGWMNSGKTTLMVRRISAFSARAFCQRRSSMLIMASRSIKKGATPFYIGRRARVRLWFRPLSALLS